MSTDTRIAAAIAALYLVLALVLLPAPESARTVGSGALVFCAIAGIARVMGRGPLHGMSVLAVAFASAFVLAVPTFPAMGGTTRAAVPLGFLGVQAAVLLWAALRWSPLPVKRSRTSLMEAWTFGALAALVLSGIATIPVLLIVITGDSSAAGILWVYPAYLVGMVGTATLYWLLQGITHLATGRYLVGFLGGASAYGAIAPVVALVQEEPLDPGMMLFIALVAGGFVGPSLALDTTSSGFGR